MNTTNRLRLFYFLYYLGVGVFSPYIGLFLTKQGMDGSQLALMLGIMPLVRILTQPLWSLLSDVYQIRRPVLTASMLMVSGVCALMSQAHSFAPLLALLIAQAAFDAPGSPLTNALTLDYLEKQGRAERFGSIRMWGSVSFIISSFIFGTLLLKAHADWLPAVYAGVMAAAAVASLLVPDSARKASAPALKDSLHVLRQKPALLLLLAGIALCGASIGMYSQYLAIYMEEIRAAEWLIGAAVALQAVSEVPLMASASKIVNRIGLGPALLVGLWVLPVRMGLYSAIREPLLVLPVQFMHGVSITSVLVVGAAFIARQLPDEWRATGQSLLSMSFGGVGSSIGLFLAGMVYTSGSTRPVWWMGAALGVAGAVVTTVAMRKSRTV
jgi:PPP family 3-phenylpropionic acid transporter